MRRAGNGYGSGLGFGFGLIAGLVDALAFLLQVKGPVVAGVDIGGQGAEPEDGLGAFESPPCACDVHPVLDQPPAGSPR